MTPKEIEKKTKAELYGRFPYEDCHWLRKHAAANEGLIPDLDVYHADIVGFASSASTLGGRKKEQLLHYLPYIRLTFFDKHPEHKALEATINTTDTPELERHLRVANMMRLEILPIIERLAIEPETERQ